MKDNTVLIYTVTLIGIALLSYILWNLDYSEQAIDEPTAINNNFCGGVISMTPQPATELEIEGKVLFKTNCAACHKIYKRATGPALYESMKKFPSDSIFHAFIKGQKVLDSLEHNVSTRANPFPHLSYKEASALKAYIQIHN